jgi:hypothetical protein
MSDLTHGSRQLHHLEDKEHRRCFHGAGQAASGLPLFHLLPKEKSV